MPDDQTATRREVDILRDELHRLDDHGSRGVGVLQSQVTDLVKDITNLEAKVEQLSVKMEARFVAHAREHEQEKRDRQANRRWIITTAMAAIGAFGTEIGIILSHIH